MSGIDLSTLAKTGGSLVFVVLAIVATAWWLRRWSPGVLAGAKEDRLRLVAAQALDARTRLVLVRRDDVEHLLVVGPGGVTVVETAPGQGTMPCKGARP